MKHTLFLYTLPLLLSLCACAGSDDEPPVASRSKVAARVRLGRASYAPGYTLTEREKMHSWWSVLVTGGVITNIISDDPAANLEQQPVQWDELPVILPEGTYTAYNFANLSQAEVEKRLGHTLAVGQQDPGTDLATLTYGTQSSSEPLTDRLPMSYRQENIVVSGLTPEQQQLDLLVQPMLAKLTLNFTNKTATQFEIEQVVVRPLNADGSNQTDPATGALTGRQNVWLLQPNSQQTEPSVPWTATAPTTSDTAAFRHQPGQDGRSSLTIPRATAQTPVQTGTTTLYLNETPKPATPAGAFALQMKVRVNQLDEQWRYGMTETTGFNNWLHRGDWLTVPVALTTYQLRAPVWFFAPIGGFPQAEIVEKNDDQFYCEFGAPGNFMFQPELSRRVSSAAAAEPDASSWLSLSEMLALSATADYRLVSWDLSISGDQLFEPLTDPVDATRGDRAFTDANNRQVLHYHSGRIGGTITDKQPAQKLSATVTLQLTMEELNGDGTRTRRTMSRQIHISRTALG